MINRFLSKIKRQKREGECGMAGRPESESANLAKRTGSVARTPEGMH